MRKYEVKWNNVLVAVIVILVGLLIAKEHKINELQLENKELASTTVINIDNSVTNYYYSCDNCEEEEGLFWCRNCEEYYDEYCESCGRFKDFWAKYCDEYVLMNYCEDCDLCYYAYCDCTESYCGEDYVQFVNDYKYYLFDCINYCEDCDKSYYYFCDCYDDNDFMMYLEDMHNGTIKNQE